jgi:Fe-S cluster assembly scaffold protein SufB
MNYNTIIIDQAMHEIDCLPDVFTVIDDSKSIEDQQLVIFVGNNAQVQIVTRHDFDVTINRSYRIVVGENSRVEHYLRMNHSGSYQMHYELSACNASVRVRGIVDLKQRQILSCNVVQKHFSSDTASDVEIRSTVEDHAQFIFRGNVFSSSGNRAVSAKLYNKNIIVSDGARVSTMPAIDVASEENVCKHGASIERLNNNQLLYLASRGLFQNKAQEILLDVFLFGWYRAQGDCCIVGEGYTKRDVLI